MVKFLIRRPIAVFMVTLSIIILGFASATNIPTALMPDISIPEITIHVDYPDNTARDIENNVVRTLRSRLLQIDGLTNLKTKSRDGSATIDLSFEYGLDMNLAYIETNEKIDIALNQLPRDLQRPKVIKASATDIPVQNIIITPIDKGSKFFLEVSELTEAIIKKRIEQLPHVALADITGLKKPEIFIEPDAQLTQSLGISNSDIIDAIERSNFKLGNIIVQNGIYQYNLNLSEPLRSISDIENILINVNGHLLTLNEIANVQLVPQRERGTVLFNGQRSILISVIKQSNARAEDLKTSLSKLMADLEMTYPELKFEIHQDQTKLLKWSISNLKSSLLIGGALAILIVFLFLGEPKLSLIIGLTIPISLVFSFLIMHVIGLSINIISLSGLILGVGMMIDNTIIVIDNISQKIKYGKSFKEASTEGATEMISPLLGSMLSTCLIFFPLMLLHGMAGALFFDQALTVTIALGTSLIVSVCLIPVLFFHLRPSKYFNGIKFSGRREKPFSHRIYKRCLHYFFKKPFLLWCTVGIFLISTIFFIYYLPYTDLPEFEPSETILELEWNENIGVAENKKRILNLFDSEHELNYISKIGEQQLFLSSSSVQNMSQSSTYVQASSAEELILLKKNIVKKLESFPNSTYKFSAPQNLFEYLFGGKDEELIAQVYSKFNQEVPSPEDLPEIRKLLPSNIPSVNLQQTSAIQLLHEKILLYDVNPMVLIHELQTAFDRNIIDNLKAEQKYLPIRLNYSSKTLEEQLKDLQVRNIQGEYVPVSDLIHISPDFQYKSISGDKAREYLQFVILSKDHYQEKINLIRENFRGSKFGVDFTGTWFTARNLGKDMLFLIFASVLLLYFILAIQFDSLLLPFIILLEIPIAMGGGLFLLWLFDGTINLMSLIGIIVMSGIIINDSIIKIHTVNELRKEHTSLLAAIEEGGEMRLNSIIMTSLTTVLALLPFLFMDGMGATLQLPLALTVIGGLTVGTFISLFLIPLLYYNLYRSSERTEMN